MPPSARTAATLMAGVLVGMTMVAVQPCTGTWGQG